MWTARKQPPPIALVRVDGTASRRTRIHPLAAGDRRAASRRTVQLPGDDTDGRVGATTLLRGPWEIRVRRVEVPVDITAREDGYDLAGRRQPVAVTWPHWAPACNGDDPASAIISRYGWDEPAAVARGIATNVFGPHSAVPVVQSIAHPDGRGLHVSLTVRSGDTVHSRAPRRAVSVPFDGIEGVSGDGDARTVTAWSPDAQNSVPGLERQAGPTSFRGAAPEDSPCTVNGKSEEDEWYAC